MAAHDGGRPKQVLLYWRLCQCITIGKVIKIYVILQAHIHIHLSIFIANETWAYSQPPTAAGTLDGAKIANHLDLLFSRKWRVSDVAYHHETWKTRWRQHYLCSAHSVLIFQIYWSCPSWFFILPNLRTICNCITFFYFSKGLPLSWYPLTTILHVCMTTFPVFLIFSRHRTYPINLNLASPMFSLIFTTTALVLIFLVLFRIVPLSMLLIPIIHLISLLSSQFFQVNPVLLSPTIYFCLTFYVCILRIFFIVYQARRAFNRGRKSA